MGIKSNYLKIVMISILGSLSVGCSKDAEVIEHKLENDDYKIKNMSFNKDNFISFVNIEVSSSKTIDELVEIGKDVKSKIIKDNKLCLECEICFIVDGENNYFENSNLPYVKNKLVLFSDNKVNTDSLSSVVIGENTPTEFDFIVSNAFYSVMDDGFDNDYVALYYKTIDYLFKNGVYNVSLEQIEQSVDRVYNYFNERNQEYGDLLDDYIKECTKS